MDDYHHEERFLSRQLKERGSPIRVIERARNKAAQKSRQSLLGDTNITLKNRITCGLEYSHLSESIRRLIFKHWHLISHILGCQNKPFVGLRKTRNLKNWIVHSDLDPRDTMINNENFGDNKNLKPCGHCTSCHQVMKGSPVIINGTTIKLSQTVTCATKMTIYALKCECQKVYVGSCRRALRVCIGEHRSRIKNKNVEAPLVSHFLENNHAPDSFEFTVLEHLTASK